MNDPLRAARAIIWWGLGSLTAWVYVLYLLGK